MVKQEPSNGHIALSRDEILAATDIVTEWVDVPEWGGGVFVRGLTATERDRMEASLLNAKGQPQIAKLETFRARMGVSALVDEHGAKLFRGDADLAALGKKSAAALDRVLDVARRLSGMSEADVEELTGNSDTDQGDGLLSG